MNTSTRTAPSIPRPYLSIGNIRMGELRSALAAMLADADWMQACQDAQSLRELLQHLDSAPEAGEDAPPPGLISLISAHADFERFRRELRATLNLPDDQPLQVTPEDWLRHRVGGYTSDARGRSRYARFRMQPARFQIG
jgi:hypothetical protein